MRLFFGGCNWVAKVKKFIQSRQRGVILVGEFGICEVCEIYFLDLSWVDTKPQSEYKTRAVSYSDREFAWPQLVAPGFFLSQNMKVDMCDYFLGCVIGLRNYSSRQHGVCEIILSATWSYSSRRI